MKPTKPYYTNSAATANASNQQTLNTPSGSGNSQVTAQTVSSNSNRASIDSMNNLTNTSGSTTLTNQSNASNQDSASKSSLLANTNTNIQHSGSSNSNNLNSKSTNERTNQPAALNSQTKSSLTPIASNISKRQLQVNLLKLDYTLGFGKASSYCRSS